MPPNPIKYPYAIIASGDSRIEDIFLLNAYQGIRIVGSPNVLVRNVYGQCLKTGITVDYCLDICRIENVHLSVYFTGLKSPLYKWCQEHAVAFEFGRTDWQYCLNTFSYGYNVGYRFYRAPDGRYGKGGVCNGNFVGIGADCVNYGIDVEDCFNIGVSVTNGEFAPFPRPYSRGVRLQKTNTGNLNLTNCTFWAAASCIAEVQSGSLNLTNCNIASWDIDKSGDPCFILGNGRLNVNSCTFNKGGYLARLEGEKSRAIFMGNMGDAALNVTNLIGDRAMFSTNNPKIEVTEK